MKQLLLPFSLIFALYASAATAETVYVTDQLRLNVYEKPNSQGTQLKTVQSGTALTVLEREPGFAKVRTPDGVTGWVKSAYLVIDKPAALIVSSTQAQMEKMKKQYIQMKKLLDQANSLAANSNNEAQSVQARLKANRKEFQEMKAKNQELQQMISGFGSSVPINVFAGSVLLAVLIGFIAGWFLLDYRIRKTHGGFRIY